MPDQEIPSRDTEAFIDYKAKVEKARFRGNQTEWRPRYGSRKWMQNSDAHFDWGEYDYRIQPRQRDYVAEMAALCHSNDPEDAHANADTILCDLLDDLGREDVVRIYRTIRKNYA